MMTLSALEISTEYRAVVEQIADLEQQASVLRKRRAELDSLAMAWMDQQGVDALKGPGITLTKQTKRAYRVDDWEVMLEWAHSRGIFPFHRRISDTVLQEIEEAGERLPECVMPQDIHQIRYRS